MANNNNTLIRITTNDPQCLFDAEIHEDIYLTPNSQIALQNLTLIDEVQSLVVDNTNNKIQFGFIQATSFTATLRHNIYSKGNYQDLLDDITIQMNKVLSYTGSSKVIGLEWLCSINLNKVDFKYIISKKITALQNLPILKGLNIGISSTGILTRTDTGTNDFNSYAAFTQPMVRGTCINRVTITTISSTDDFDIIIGCFNFNPNNVIKVYNDGDLFYGVRASKTKGFYQFYVKGIISDTAIVPANGDIMTIELNNGKIQYNVYQQANATATQLHELDYEYGLYYPVVFLYALTVNSTISSFVTYLNSFTNSINNQEEEEEALGANIPPGGQVNTSNYNFITFAAPSLANYLGFSNLQSGFQIAKEEWEYKANKFFDTSYVPESIIVELLNIDVKSYDSLTNKRKNILAVIPNPLSINERIIFDSQYPLYLSLRNTNSFSLRNIKARILNSDLSSIEINGVASMTLLIK